MKYRVKKGLSTGPGLISAAYNISQLEDDFASQTDDKRLLIIESEFGALLARMGRPNSDVSAIIRQAWDDGNLENLTKVDPYVIHNAHISLIGHITLNELERMDATGGILQWVCKTGFCGLSLSASKILASPLSPPKSLMNSFAGRLTNAVKFSRTVGEVKRDDVAEELWCSNYALLSGDRPGLLGSVVGRAEAYVLRLSLIYALLDSSLVVREAHLARAFAVWGIL